MKLVYLCGPITGMTYGDARYGWREYAAKRIADATAAPTWNGEAVQVISPMRAKNYLNRETRLAAMGYAGSAMSSPKGITTRDRYDVQRADVILANLLGIVAPEQAVVHSLLNQAKQGLAFSQAELDTLQQALNTRASIGSMIEFGWADSARVPVVTAIEAEGNVHDHCISTELMGFRLDNLDAAIDVVLAILNTGV